MQCQAKARQPGRLDDRPPGSSDISLLSPELQQQWDVERNMHLGAIKIKPNSGSKAVWQCDKCPAGQPHTWAARVYDRALKGTKCPYCNNRRLCLHNCLATVAPDVAQYWNHSRNEKVPEQVLAGSRLRAEWKCPACGWEWQTSVAQRVVNRSGCPKCSQKKQSRQSQPTFAEAEPACLDQWNYELNGARGIYPDTITLGSNKPVHWLCSCCPRGQPHCWTASPNKRINNGQGCAVCAGRQACSCNSLASLFPLVAAEFDVDKNGFTPSEIPARSMKIVWWRNAKRGSWQQTPNVCTDMRNKLVSQQVWLGCPFQASIDCLYLLQMFACFKMAKSHSVMYSCMSCG